MKKIAVSLAIVLLAIVIAPSVAVGDTMSFNYVFTTLGNTAFGNGVLDVTGSAIGPGEYRIGSGTITLYGASAPGTPSGATGTLIPITEGSGSASGYYPGAYLSPSGAIYFDDILYSESNPLLDPAGLLFSIGGTEFNIYSNGSPTNAGLVYSVYDNNGLADVGNFNVIGSVTPTPEPASLFLLGVGLLGLALALFRTKTRESARTL